MTDLRFQPGSIEPLRIDQLRPYARNPRTHSDDQVAKLAASLVEFGWTMPILVNDELEVIAGHGRILAARRLGLDAVPVIRLAHLSPEQVRAYRIADNKLALDAGWDEELLAGEFHELNGAGYDLGLTGFSAEELDELLAPIGDGSDLVGDPDKVPEPPAHPVSRPGDLWVLGSHRLLCGDSTSGGDVTRLMHGERAILFATDPPYLVDYDGTNHPGKTKVEESAKNKDWSGTYAITWDDASQGPELYEGFIRAAIEHAIAPNAAWYCWHASRRQAMVEGVWEKLGAFVHQQVIWNKTHGILTRSFYLWKHEPCFMGWLKGHKPPRVADDYVASVWDIRSLYGEDRPDHPTPKPLDCFAIPMRQHVRPGGLCYEPFSGSGSQIMAGEVTGRRVFAMEISPVYVDVAVLRWQQATGQQAVLEDDGRTFEALAFERLAAAA